MTRSLVATIAAAAVLTVAALHAGGQPEAQRTAVVTGYVFAADTSLPVPEASVRLYGAAAARPTSTDATGRFEIRDVPPGRYILSALTGGYAIGAWGQQRPTGVPPRIVVRAGETRRGADIWLAPLGSITGHIHDEAGMPARGVTVQALRRAGSMEAQSPTRPPTTTTDENGAFRFSRIASGDYFVVAAPPGARSTPQAQAAPAARVPTYHPGTVHPGGAGVVRVEAGIEAYITFGLQRGRAARIAGVILTSDGRPSQDHVVLLNGRPPTIPPSVVNLPFAETGADGRFAFEQVPPGHYDLDVKRTEGFIKIATSGGGGINQVRLGESASLTLHVTGDDVEDLVLRTSPGFEVSGRVTVEGGSVDSLRGAQVVTRPATVGGSGFGALLPGSVAAVDADGRFRIENLAGTQFVRMQGLPDGWMLKRVSVAGADVTDTGLDLTGPTSLDIVIGKPSEVIGQVVDEDGAGVPDITVFVFSEDPQRWSLPHTRFVARTEAGADGRFQVAGLPAGRYGAAAAMSLIEGRVGDVSSLERLATSATPVSVGEGERARVTIEVR